MLLLGAPLPGFLTRAPARQVAGRTSPASLRYKTGAAATVAFAELYDTYLDSVYRYAYYRTGNRHPAEYLTEQVFLQA